MSHLQYISQPWYGSEDLEYIALPFEDYQEGDDVIIAFGQRLVLRYQPGEHYVVTSEGRVLGAVGNRPKYGLWDAQLPFDEGGELRTGFTSRVEAVEWLKREVCDDE